MFPPQILKRRAGGGKSGAGSFHFIVLAEDRIYYVLWGKLEWVVELRDVYSNLTNREARTQILTLTNGQEFHIVAENIDDVQWLLRSV